MSGNHSGSIVATGATSSYTFAPGSGGTATVASCAISNGAVYSVAIYGAGGSLLGKGTTSSYCNWASAPVSAGQTYTVTTSAVSGSGTYRSAWSVNGATVSWSAGSTLGTTGASKSFSFPIVNAGPIAVSSCGPPGTIFDLALTSASGSTLATSTAPSNCQSLAYTPPARGLFRMIETSVSGTGAYTATITTT